jgi:hypothetical protein
MENIDLEAQLDDLMICHDRHTESKKAVEFMIPTPRVPTVGAN